MNDNKLLYLLPDSAYSADLLPTKKPHSFAVQNFLQVNGKFMDENSLLEGNFDKLIDRIGNGSYHLILPDFLFTNTILNIEEDTEAKVMEHVNKKLLPELGLNEKEYEIKTFVLTEHKGIYKVQLSALEKSLLEPIKNSLKGKSISISSITPLSWTLKSVISLEPSISLLQMGDNVYLAQHYIGVDQANYAAVGDVEHLVETIKTLKGSEPSIQTIYLLSSELVEEKLKEGLSNTLPLQQLTSSDDEEAKMPSYIKHAIESGMRTLSIPDYSVPKFSLGKVAKSDVSTKEKESASTVSDTTGSVPVVVGDDLPKPSAALATPTAPTASAVVDTTSVSSEVKEENKVGEKIEKVESLEPSDSKESSDLDSDSDKSDLEKNTPVIEVSEKAEEDKIEKNKEESGEAIKPEVSFSNSIATSVPVVGSDNSSSSDSDESKAEPKKTEKKIEEKTEEKPVEQKPEKESAETPAEEKGVDISQFTSNQKTEKEQGGKSMEHTTSTPHKKIIKEKTGISGMLKMFFIGLVSFSATVAVGVGIGLGVLSLSNNPSDPANPIADTPQANPTETVKVEVSPTPTPEPKPDLEKGDLKVLVVNATTVSGYAGKIGKKLEAGGFENIKAANAKGDYEDGLYVLIAEEDDAIIDAVSEDTSAEFIYKEGKETEDPKDLYDFVVVLAETIEEKVVEEPAVEEEN